MPYFNGNCPKSFKPQLTSSWTNKVFTPFPRVNNTIVQPAAALNGRLNMKRLFIEGDFCSDSNPNNIPK